MSLYFVAATEIKWAALPPYELRARRGARLCLAVVFFT